LVIEESRIAFSSARQIQSIPSSTRRAFHTGALLVLFTTLLLVQGVTPILIIVLAHSMTIGVGASWLFMRAGWASEMLTGLIQDRWTRPDGEQDVAGIAAK
jgi:hypothetical protein